jgi:serine phosphatase RsbU (regulator of sigma subunit)
VRYSQLNDSIFNLSKAKDLGRLESKHEFEVKEKQILADQLHERELANAEKKQQRFILIIVSIGLVLVISLFIYLLTRFRLIKRQNQLIDTQRKILWERQKEISDSINYAERIQRSFLASDEELNKSLNNYFVLFQPKDVVSGDFYWASNLNNGNIAYCCADSTGHGVPGAIMSVLNISSLEKSIETKTSPSEILNETRKIIIDRLKKDGSVEGGKDGMDASLIVLNKERTKLKCAAANSPVWILREGKIIEIIPDKMPVGKHERDHIPFTEHEIDLQKGDLIFTLTDGMPDQFGGPKGKKYKYTKLKEFLLGISTLSLAEQKQKLEQEFTNWKGDIEQTDDVCLIGVRI